MATPAQVYAALTIENTYHILYPTAPKNYSQFNDITNWAGLGYTTGAGDVVKGIFKCIDPAGQVIYENAGYASDDFSSQDWDLTDLTAPQFNLLTYTGTDTPIYGDYLFLWKVKIYPYPNGPGGVTNNTTQSPSIGVPQINRVTITGSPVAGDIFTLILSGETVTYTVTAGQTLSQIRTGITNAIIAYSIAHPLGAWANDVTLSGGGANLDIQAVSDNTPFILTASYTPLNNPNAFQVDKQFSVGLSNGLAPQLSLEESYDCNAATYTSVDTTVYGAPAGYTLQNIARTHVTRPPLVSKQSNGTTAQSAVTSSSQTNLLAATANPLWTGAYSSSIAAILTYKSGNNYTIVNCAAIEKDLVVTCDNGLCDLFCYLKKLYTKYFEYVAAGNSVLASMELAKWQKASDIFLLIQKAITCSTGDVAALTSQFYAVTGFTQGCDCGCSGDEPAPVIPTTSINGTNGTDGLTAEFRFSGTLFQWKYTTEVGWTTLFDFSTIATAFLQGSGAPSNGDGNNGDTYLDVDSGNIYLKTAGAWAITGNLLSNQLLYNNFADQDTTTALAWETLDSYQIPAATLTTNGDEVVFSATLTTSSWTSEEQLTRILFNGSAFSALGIPQSFTFVNIQKIVYTGRIVRTSNTTANVVLNIKSYTDNYAWISEYQFPLLQLATLNFTTTAYTLAVQGYSAVIGDITSESLEITFNR